MTCAQPHCGQTVTPCPPGCGWPGCNGVRHTGGTHLCAGSLHHNATVTP